jgi:undecaprenyl-diphosphatase
MPLLATLLAVGLALLWRRRTPVVLMAIAAAGSLLMTAVGKTVVGRGRPPVALAVPPLETSPSFPSGHSLNAVVVAGLVAYLLVLRLHSVAARVGVVAVAAAFSVAMGLSRVFLGHHWLTDVLVAWALGLGWLAVVVTGHRVWLARAVPADVLRSQAAPP